VTILDQWTHLVAAGLDSAQVPQVRRAKSQREAWGEESEDGDGTVGNCNAVVMSAGEPAS
jgi:hypothetical protein